MKAKAGFSILAMMIIIWSATLIGYGINKLVTDKPKAETVSAVKQDNAVSNFK
jgi:hypothetical protein